jgi:hypothetical protein
VSLLLLLRLLRQQILIWIGDEGMLLARVMDRRFVDQACRAVADATEINKGN